MSTDKLTPDDIAYLQQSEAMYQQEKKAHAQTRRDLDARDHQHAEDRAEIERLRERLKQAAQDRADARFERDELFESNLKATARAEAVEEKLSLVTEDYIKERNAATVAEAEIERLKPYETQVNVLEKEAERLREALEDERLLMERMLTKLEHFESRIPGAPTVASSWAAAQMPEWEIRQRLDALRAALRDEPEEKP